MHEVSIAQGLLDIVVENCRKQGCSGIESIKVKIGKASGIVPDSLFFAFETMKVGTLAEKASLTIEHVPISGFCNSCNSSFTVDDAYIICCPHCNSFEIRVDTGRELNVDEMEVF
ncbi:MAG: hydrogenase maturation nickel metallochaperone HypA [Nitrospirota bacterium]